MKTHAKIGRFAALILLTISMLAFLNSCQPDNEKESDNPKTTAAAPNSHTHSWSSWQMLEAATCIEAGSEERSCSCGEKETRATEALGHSEGDWVTDKEATCTKEGLRSKKCSLCGIVLKTETINVTGHKEGEWIIVKEATLSENGSKNLPCTLCGAVLKTEVVYPEIVIYSIDEFYNGLALISTNKGYGYINSKGKIVIDPCYTTAGRFYTELARVKIDGKYGYINTKGELVISTQYSSAPEKLGWVGTVEKDGITQVINFNGKVIYTAGKNDIIGGEDSNGYFWVESSRETLSGTEYLLSYYDYCGKLVIEFNNAKNAGVYSTPNEYGYAYIQEIIKKGSGLYKDQCAYALVNVNGYSKGILRQDIKAVNGNYYIDSDGKVRYLEYDMYPEYGLYLAKTDEVELIYDLNQTITPMCEDGEWSASFYLLAPRGTWDGYFANNANKDIVNNYYVDITYIVQSGDGISADFKKGYPEFSDADVKCINACMNSNFDIRYLVLLKNNNGTIFSAILDRSCDLVSSPTNEYELGYSKQAKINYQYYTLYQFYSGDSDIFELDYKYVIAKDPNSGLFGYVDLINGEWAIQPQYKSVTNFKGDGEESVAVVNGNTIINTSGQVVFTIAD